MPEFNIQSNDHLSLLFYGGKISEEGYEPIITANGSPVLYKTGQKKGQIKLKKVKKDIKIKGLGIIPKFEWKAKKVGFYKTNEEILEILNHPIANLLLEIRGLEKLLNTYYIEDYIYPEDFVHPNFNLVSTDTGRTSANKPNSQNVPAPDKFPVKEHFISRFFPYGKFVKADYSQIEIVVQAQLSQDKKYIYDVLNGVDFHCKRLAAKEKVSYEEIIKQVKQEKNTEWINKRSKVKAFSFSRAYGAGKQKISAQTGLSEEEVQELIKLEDLEYDRLKIYNDSLFDMVKFTAKRDSSTEFKIGWYKSFTGRQYYFRNELAPEWLQKRGEQYSFRPTKIKNYMIQGTAFDVISIMIGKFWREHAIHNRYKYLMINFVHDELDLDCTDEFMDDLKQDLQLLRNIDRMCLSEFSYKWDLPVNIDIKEGLNWSIE